jgi:hypothetical protein
MDRGRQSILRKSVKSRLSLLQEKSPIAVVPFEGHVFAYGFTGSSFHFKTELKLIWLKGSLKN